MKLGERDGWGESLLGDLPPGGDPEEEEESGLMRRGAGRKRRFFFRPDCRVPWQSMFLEFVADLEQ